MNEFYQSNVYDCHQSSTLGSALTGKMRHLLAVLDGQLPKSNHRRILDFGCGAGDFMVAATQSGWDAVGFEPGRRGRENCISRGLAVVERLDELSAGTFNMVTLHHVFEHIGDHAGVLKSIEKLLAPGGRIFIEVPNAASLRARLSFPILSRRFGFDERYRAFPIHLTYFTPKTIKRLLEENGYQVDYLYTSGMGLEELKSKPTPSENQPGKPSSTNRVSRGGWFRRFVKWSLFRSGLGENLEVVCSPKKDAGTMGA